MARRYLGTVLTLLIAGTAAAQQVHVREEMLPNGMRLLMVERHDSPTVACGWVAKVGSVNEAPGITGISHLFEHMMFKGTRTIGTSDFPKDAEIMAEQDAIRAEMEKEYTILRGRLRRGELSGNIYDPANMTPRLKELKAQIEKLYAAEKQVIVKDEIDQIYTREGGSGLNAFTTEDQTVFFVTVPSNKLELWFWMESDRLANPVFREFYSERDVVREERRLRTESEPTGKFEEAFEALFWESSPYSHPVMGWPADVESINRKEAESYFATYYAPNNLTAAIVGDFDSDRALALAREYFGRVPAGKATPPEMITDETPQLAQKRFLAEADTNPEVEVRFHAVPFNNSEMFAFQLIADLLNQRTGRLYKALVEGRKTAAGEPSCFYRPMKYEGYLEADAEVKDGRTPEEVEAGLISELDRLAGEPVGERELQKVKNQELANSFRRLQSNFHLLLQLLLYDSTDTWTFINESPGKVQAVTAADIQRVAKKYFTKENRTVAVYTRKEAAAPEDPDLAAVPPDARATVTQQLGEIVRLTDRAKIEQVLRRMHEMAPRVPPDKKAAFEYLVKKTKERLDSLSAAPENGSEVPQAPPAGGKPKA